MTSLKVLYRIGRADKITADSVHALWNQPYIKKITCENSGNPRTTINNRNQLLHFIVGFQIVFLHDFISEGNILQETNFIPV